LRIFSQRRISLWLRRSGDVTIWRFHDLVIEKRKFVEFEKFVVAVSLCVSVLVAKEKREAK
jgi:hypothetical protein